MWGDAFKMGYEEIGWEYVCDLHWIETSKGCVVKTVINVWNP
jgi:hypothetical protein